MLLLAGSSDLYISSKFYLPSHHVTILHFSAMSKSFFFL